MQDEFHRKKLLYKSLNRGVKETDILLGNFAREHIFLLSDEEIKQYTAIVEISDFLLYKYLAQSEEIPKELPLLKKIIEFNQKKFSKLNSENI